MTPTVKPGLAVRPTFNSSPPTAWEEILRAEFVPSQRHTTSSRLPGRDIAGTVWRRRVQVVACPACGGIRRDSAGPHAPQWRDGRLVDCVGREVTP